MTGRSDCKTPIKVELQSIARVAPGNPARKTPGPHQKATPANIPLEGCGYILVLGI